MFGESIKHSIDYQYRVCSQYVYQISEVIHGSDISLQDTPVVLTEGRHLGQNILDLPVPCEHSTKETGVMFSTCQNLGM